MAMTAEPFYRWLSQQQHWQPPSENYVMKESRYPTAAQDLRNLFGNFFAQNPAQSYRVQYQPSPYQTTMPTGYNPAQPVPQPPAGSLQDRIKQTWTNDIAPPAVDFAKQQALDAALTGMATGGTLYGVSGMIRPHLPLAMATLATTRLGAPIVNGINRFANSPVGKFVGKIADFIW